ncbi:uridine phosphorylase, partial [Proteus mirabilis]
VIVNRTQQEIPDAELLKKTENNALGIVIEAARTLMK